MVKIILASLILISSTVFAADCSDVNKVAKEAVAYAMLGAWETFTTHACFKNERFEYFKPQIGVPTGEVNSTSNFFYFEKGRDHYAIESVTPEGTDYIISVRFHVGKKDLLTHYRYRPKPEYHKATGICGYVVNQEHGIFRKDCVVPSRLPSSLKKK